MKNIFIKGFLVAAPLVLTEHAFLFAANRSGISEEYLTFIKPALLGIFFVFAVGIPVYLSLTDGKPVSESLKQMIAVIAIAWAFFTGESTLTAILLFPKMDGSLQNTMRSLFLIYITGFPLLALGCSLVAAIGKRILAKRDKPNEAH